MAVRTYSQLISDISNYLASATRITASEHRTLETNVVDTLFNSGNGSGARPYKVYTALLTQTSTNAPVATVLENTLGGTLVWSYSSAGDYYGTLSGVFLETKTWTTCPAAPSTQNNDAYIRLVRSSDNAVELVTVLSGTNTDDLIYYTPIEIRVYS